MEVAAFSETTGISYQNWEALVDAEANGFVVTAVISRGSQTWPWSKGPYDTKHEADLARNRLRTRCKRELDSYPGTTYKLFIRPLWKDPR